jgi:hypothetical protein
MAAPDQGYERVLDELETISATFNTLVDNLDFSNIREYIEKVSTQSHEQMEMLESSKKKIIFLRAQNNALQEQNTTLQHENTMLTMNKNVTTVIVKEEHGPDSSSSSAEASPVLTHRRQPSVGNHQSDPILEGSETEDGSETDDEPNEQLFDSTEGGEGGEGGEEEEGVSEGEEGKKPTQMHDIDLENRTVIINKVLELLGDHVFFSKDLKMIQSRDCPLVKSWNRVTFRKLILGFLRNFDPAPFTQYDRIYHVQMKALPEWDSENNSWKNQARIYMEKLKDLQIDIEKEGGVPISVGAFVYPDQKQEMEISDERDPEVEEEEYLERGEEEDENGVRVWRGDSWQIKKILDYIGNYFFVEDTDLEPKYKFRFNGGQGHKLTLVNLEKSTQIVVLHFKNKTLAPFSPQNGSKFKIRMENHKLWGPEGDGNLKGKIEAYLEDPLFVDI